MADEDWVKMTKNILVIILLVFQYHINSANASGANQFYQISNLCNIHFSYFENQYNIPVNLLRTIAIAESGRYHSELKKVLPWPWTVNQGGKAYYFKNRNDALVAVRSMIEQGITNIDVGCMQINLGYHAHNFKNLDHAFDPQHNINFAAKLLKSHYGEFSNWKNAIMAYHSRSDIGKDYYNRVIEIWKKSGSHNIFDNQFSREYGKIQPDFSKNGGNSTISYKSYKLRPERIKSKLLVD